MTLKEFMQLPEYTPIYSSGKVWFKLGERDAIDLNGFEERRLPPPEYLDTMPTCSEVPKQEHFVQYMTQGSLQVFYGGIEWTVVGAFLTKCWLKRGNEMKSARYHETQVSNFTKGESTYWMPWRNDIKEMWNKLKNQ
jgi:hypothetical protein